MVTVTGFPLASVPGRVAVPSAFRTAQTPPFGVGGQLSRKPFWEAPTSALRMANMGSEAKIRKNTNPRTTRWVSTISEILFTLWVRIDESSGKSLGRVDVV